MGYLWESQEERDDYRDQDMWQDIKLNIREMGGMDWINLA
jgi:hypothetical protein